MSWPGKIPPASVSGQMLMTIDLFPTIAKLTGTHLPDHMIDGKDVWPIISGKSGAKNPHKAYWFYYELNQLQSVCTADGRWKLMLPHTYQTLGGRPGGRDGVPAKYERLKLRSAELYDLAVDIGQKEDVANQHPDIVKKLQRIAEAARAELGDNLTGRKGAGVREPGRLPGELTATPDKTVFRIGSYTVD